MFGEIKDRGVPKALGYVFSFLVAGGLLFVKVAVEDWSMEDMFKGRLRCRRFSRLPMFRAWPIRVTSSYASTDEWTRTIARWNRDGSIALYGRKSCWVSVRGDTEACFGLDMVVSIRCLLEVGYRISFMQLVCHDGTSQNHAVLRNSKNDIGIGKVKGTSLHIDSWHRQEVERELSRVSGRSLLWLESLLPKTTELPSVIGVDEDSEQERELAEIL
ncbi:hypothetical protein K3495_g15152 [Podosphaera aphanis]|nr:hypothetical protein K3495_g15152 [Podosphaera aphanis]